MKDAEYLFKQTAAERKRIGRGDYSKKRGSKSKKCSLPHDGLTRKEWERMNGEIKTYSMERPVKWETFKQWPVEIQKNYLAGLQEKFNAKSSDIAAMLGVSPKTLFLLTRQIGFAFKMSRSKVNLEAWKAFLGEEIIGKVVEPEVLVAAEENSAIEVREPEKIDTVDVDQLRVDHLCCLLQALKGTGAKVTIEVTL